VPGQEGAQLVPQEGAEVPESTGHQGTQTNVLQGLPAGPGGREHQESDSEGRGTLATRASSLSSLAEGTTVSIEVVSGARSTEGVTRELLQSLKTGQVSGQIVKYSILL
jgi:hypothetical protein